MDLVDMSNLKDDEYKFILTIIDVFSKYAWAIPLKNKKASTVLTAFKDIIEDSGRYPYKIWADQGSEFYNKNFEEFLNEMGIEIYSTYGNSHCAVIERFNRTLKTNMWKQFTEKQSEKWVELLPELLDEYNNKTHSTIKMTPTEASTKKKEKELKDVVDTADKPKKKIKSKFKVGDTVRISRIKKHFEKGYTINWSSEIFTISTVQNTEPITYKIKDLHDEIIEGSFYEQELQKTEMANKFFIEKIIKTRMKKGKKEMYVKWIGYDNSFNNWIGEDSVKEISQ
jgi:flagellar hook-basal body complex protein FliE